MTTTCLFFRTLTYKKYLIRRLENENSHNWLKGSFFKGEWK